MTARTAVVVGAGIMGASTAWALHRRGWQVTLLDAGPIPNPHGSSGGVHRLIRTTYGDMAGYTTMALQAYDAWREVWADLGRELWAHTGMLAVDAGEHTFGADTRAVFDELDQPYELLDAAEVRRRHPQFRITDGETALWSDQAHYLRARDTVGALASWLAREGAEVRPGTRARAVDVDAGRVETDGGEVLQADAVVVAAGPWSRQVEGVDWPELVPSRQVVVDLRVPEHLRDAWATGPGFLVPPAYGIPPREELPLKVGDHHFSRVGHPDDDRAPRPEEVTSVLDVVADALVDFGAYELLDARVCYYTVRDDERFVVEPRGDRGAVLAGFSGHGFKMGPVVGQRVADAVDGSRPWSAVTAWAAAR